MQPRASRATSTALSLALHALLLFWVMGVTVNEPQSPTRDVLPVRILEPPARPPAPPRAAQPPPPVARAEPPAPAAEVPPPEAPQAEPPAERKLPLPEQIVQPPDAGQNVAPPDTRFKSDRDVTVEKQQVKRGEPKPGESAPGESAAAEAVKPPPRPKPPAPKPQPARPGVPGRPKPPQVAALPSIDTLLPNALKLAQEGYGQPPEPPPAERVERRLARGGADGLFIPTGPTGTFDYLPDIREGDITLLNTKADVFAPFVRRVAVRVFQNMLIALKRDLTYSNISTQEAVEAQAIMSPAGDMIGFSIGKRSTRVSLSLDRRLQQACTVGFFDRNPPPGARAKDGNIYFVFEAGFEAQPTPQGLAWYVRLGTGLL